MQPAAGKKKQKSQRAPNEGSCRGCHRPGRHFGVYFVYRKGKKRGWDVELGDEELEIRGWGM